MPAKSPLTSIECRNLSHLSEELGSVQDALSVPETEETWDSIAKALIRFGALCNGNANNHPADLVLALRSSARPLTSALNSERTRLSGTATELVTIAVTALGSAFEPLIPHYFPTVLTLCTRTNKVFLTRAKTCIASLVEYTLAPAIIRYCAESVTDKSVSLRLAAAETMMLCLKSFNPPDLEKEQRAREIEATIRATAVDASADVRKVGRKLFDAYKILLPSRVQSFTDPLTPRTRKYLDIKGTAASRSQPPSRPTSSQSVRSVSSDTRPTIVASSSHPSTSTTAPKHVRSGSTSQVVLKRPLRAPTPEVVAPTHLTEVVRRPAREEPRRLKVDMPPPDYIPNRVADAGPQRPMSATELYFPATHATTGPQRVVRDGAQPSTSSTTNPVRSGPIRPAGFSLRPSGSDEIAAAEKKERVVGGARRVLRMPEATESAEGKGRAPASAPAPAPAASKPIRPRVISTSKSTPAVPLHAAVAKEEMRVKKLASSLGASSKPSAVSKTSSTHAPAPAPAAKLSRTTSSSTLTQPTAGSRARVAEKTQQKEKVHKDVREKERVVSKAAPKTSAAPRPAASATVTVRDRTSRALSKSGTDTAKPEKESRKVSQVVSTKTRSSPEVPDTKETMSPVEVPLPDSPKVIPRSVPSPPALICLDTPEKEDTPAPVPVPEVASTPAPAPNNIFDNSVLTPAHVPLAPCTPSSEDEPTVPSTPTLVPVINVGEPHTPTTAVRSCGRCSAVEQTPISALVMSIQRGFLSMHGGTPLSPMREEDEPEGDGKVFSADNFQPTRVEPLFSRPGTLHA